MDEVRLLARRSEYGYVSTTVVAVTGEPECVDAWEQERQTRAAADREQHVWQTSRARLLNEISHLEAHVKSVHAQRAARALRREVEALDRRMS